MDRYNVTGQISKLRSARRTAVGRPVYHRTRNDEPCFQHEIYPRTVLTWIPCSGAIRLSRGTTKLNLKNYTPVHVANRSFVILHPFSPSFILLFSLSLSFPPSIRFPFLNRTGFSRDKLGHSERLPLFSKVSNANLFFSPFFLSIFSKSLSFSLFFETDRSLHVLLQSSSFFHSKIWDNRLNREKLNEWRVDRD